MSNLAEKDFLKHAYYLYFSYYRDEDCTLSQYASDDFHNYFRPYEKRKWRFERQSDIPKKLSLKTRLNLYKKRKARGIIAVSSPDSFA